MPDGKLVVERLSQTILNERDDAIEFCCGNNDIDDFIHEEALIFQNERLGVTYIFRHEAKIIAFITLSMANLRKKGMRSEDKLEVGREHYPALQIGQLAVCNDYQNSKIGTFLCDFCFDRALKFSERIGCRFLILNAREEVIGFYEKYGFKLLPDQDKRIEKMLFLNIIPKVLS